MAWHALSRPTPFSFATVNKTKFTRPPGHAMWGGWDHPPFGGSPRPITPCSSPGCIEAPGGRLSDFGGEGRGRAGVVVRACWYRAGGWLGRTDRCRAGGRVSGERCLASRPVSGRLAGLASRRLSCEQAVIRRADGCRGGVPAEQAGGWRAGDLGTSRCVEGITTSTFSDCLSKADMSN